MKKKEYILNYDMVFVTVFSIVILVLTILLTWGIIKLTGDNFFTSFFESFVGKKGGLYTFMFYVIMFLWLVLHEIIHYIAYRINGASKDNIVFGIALEKGVFYCKCREYIDKKNIMISLISPFMVIGVITYILGFVIKSGLLVSLSIVNICGAAADLMMFFFFLKQKDDVEFKEMGFSSPFCLKTTDNLENKKFLGIKDIRLVKDDKETYEAKEKKITVTKFSYIFGLILLIILILDIIIYFI